MPKDSHYRLLLQFGTYVLSGLAAAVIALGAYQLFIQLGIWYVVASVLCDGVGLLATFLFQKYLVFQKKEQLVPHALRYALVQVMNTILQVAIVYALVEFARMDTVLAKTLSIGITVPSNFFLYKFFVYV